MNDGVHSYSQSATLVLQIRQPKLHFVKLGHHAGHHVFGINLQNGTIRYNSYCTIIHRFAK